jgi:hypothetical protein
MVHIHAEGETPSGQTPPPGGGPDTEPEEPVEPFSFTYYHAAGAASSGGERRMVQDPFQYSQMPIYGEDPDGPGPVEPPEIGYYWRTGWIEAPETGATGWASDATRSVTFSGETFAENQNSLLNFMDGIMTGPGSSQPGQGASSSWTVGETVGNPVLITGGAFYFEPDETHVSTSPPDPNATVPIGGAETCSLECSGLRGEVKSQAAPRASATFIFTWTEALTTDVGPPVIHYGTATLTNGTSGACWTIEGNGPITNAAPDPHDLQLKPPLIKGKSFSVGPLLPVEFNVTINTFIPHNNIAHPNNWMPGIDTVFAGDNRSSGSPARATWSETGSHRTQQKLKLMPIQSADANGLVDNAFGANADGQGHNDRYVHIGESHEFEMTSSLDSSGNITGTAWADSTVGDSTLMVAKGTANQNTVWVESTTWLGDRKLAVKCRCNSGNPLVTGAPGIGYTLTITADYTDLSAPKYSLEGTHDGFPAYEVYINSTRVHHYDPLATGEGPWSLGPPEEKSVSTPATPVP